MACRCDEVKQDVDTIVPETRVTLDTRLLSKNIIILSLEIADNLSKAGSISLCDVSFDATSVPCFIIDLVTKPRGVNNGEGNTSAFFIELCKWQVYG